MVGDFKGRDHGWVRRKHSVEQLLFGLEDIVLHVRQYQDVPLWKKSLLLSEGYFSQITTSPYNPASPPAGLSEPRTLLERQSRHKISHRCRNKEKYMSSAGVVYIGSAHQRRLTIDSSGTDDACLQRTKTASRIGCHWGAKRKSSSTVAF